MNLTISSRFFARTFRQNFCRYLSSQSSVDKSNNRNGVSNFHRRFENRSSNFLLFRQPFEKSLCNRPLPLCASFQRNFSKTTEDPLNFEKTMDSETVNSSLETKTFEEEMEEILTTCKNVVDDFSETTVVKYAEDLLIEMHNITGLPWWASIALTAFFIRTTIVLPFSVTQVKVMGKLQVVTLHLRTVVQRLKIESEQACKRFGWPREITDEKFKQAVKLEWNDLMVKENCHPFKTIFPLLVQIPTWAIFSAALRNLSMPPADGVAASDTYTQLSTGGFGTITDLTAVDPLVLPVTLGVLYCLTIETHRLFRAEPYVSAEQLKCLLLQCLNLMIVALSMSSPSALNIYWISSASYGLIQAFILNTQTSYRLLNIPVLHTPMEHPYRLFNKNLKNRFKKKEKEPIFIIEK